MQAEALEVVLRRRESGDLELAPVARARVDLPDVEGASEEPPHIVAEPRPEHLEVGVGGGGLGDDAGTKREAELADHDERARRGARRDSWRSAFSIVWLPVSWVLNTARATSSSSPTRASRTA